MTPLILRRPCLSHEPAHTFARDQFTSLKFDYIFANPPFNIYDWG
jgi:type I restriction-modification system DNA methylase subunit